ncbi:terminase [Hydrogenophaga sp.]|uniref:terminase n=1 Tax=Hydrogenophaga sp. TaxID=1904254 RepID=UPI0025BCF225|nr:terminase [Hydrogenophaga sp.]MBT9467206.1 terminase [Hydrogenophaga sp.]
MSINHAIDWKPAFLAALREVPVVLHGCEAAGVARTTAYRARETDSAFAEAWDDAMEAGIDRAEKEAMRRAVVGFEEPVIDKGLLAYRMERHVGEDGAVKYQPVLDANGQPVPLTVRKHSDQLLALVLKGRRKSVYAERIEQTGANGGPIEIDPTKRAARVAALLALAQRRASGEDACDLC